MKPFAPSTSARMRCFFGAGIEFLISTGQCLLEPCIQVCVSIINVHWNWPRINIERTVICYRAILIHRQCEFRLADKIDNNLNCIWQVKIIRTVPPII